MENYWKKDERIVFLRVCALCSQREVFLFVIIKKTKNKLYQFNKEAGRDEFPGHYTNAGINTHQIRRCCNG